MKKAKHIFIALAGMFLAKNASAQMFITAGGGYSFPANKQFVGWEYTADASKETFTGVYSTLGHGLSGGAMFGYNLCEYGGIEIGYSYLYLGQVAMMYDDRSDTGMTITGSDEMGMKMNRITIGGRFSYGEGNFKPYLRTGLVLGVGGKFMDAHYRTYQSGSGTSTETTWEEYTGGIAWGFATGLGANYMFSSSVGIYFEAAFIGQSWAPQNSIYTKYEIDGVDQLPNMTTSEKETVYLDELSFTSAAPNDNAPSEDLKYFLPMSSLGINAGVVIILGAK